MDLYRGGLSESLPLSEQYLWMGARPIMYCNDKSLAYRKLVQWAAGTAEAKWHGQRLVGVQRW